MSTNNQVHQDSEKESITPDMVSEEANHSSKQHTKKSSKDDKTMIILAHGLTIVAGFVPPLVILLITESELVKSHAKMALNWQISFTIYLVSFTIVSFILTILTFGLFGFIASLGFVALGIFSLVLAIMAMIKANENPEEIWQYPVTIPFIK